MTELKPFQVATVDAVMAAFDRRRRNRRFLVADEVGLGKTVVAQHVVRRMMRQLNRPLVVFYLCSNLTIARQNRRKLLEVLPREEREWADCPVDRLSLLRASDPPEHEQLHLYSLTPDTSIPIRRRHRRDGRQEERALVHALVERIWPALLKEWGRNVFRGSARVHWKYSVQQQREVARNTALRHAFVRSVRQEFQLEPGQHLLPELNARWDAGQLTELDLIAHLRNALAASAIEEVSPDLVIFDEFQRFRDLLEPQQDEASQRVIGRLRGDDTPTPPALLLLSATPYRLFTRRWEEESGATHRAEFFELIEFLYGGDDYAKPKRTECEGAFVELESELRKGQPDSDAARHARSQIEELLSPVIARTERASHHDGWDQFDTESLPSPVEHSDLDVFKHLSNSFDDAHRASAVAYWTSIPLPMQTMGNQYVAWKSASASDGEQVPCLNERDRDTYQLPKRWPHPRLRALRELVSTEQLAVPWLPPTSPWWSLKGVWGKRRQLPRKLLVFSRFRAVPQALAAALSYELEAELLRSEQLPYGEVTRRRLLSATENRHALLALFHPSPLLVSATDPLAARASDPYLVRRKVASQLKKALSALGVTISDKAAHLPIWKLIARLESRAGNWEDISWNWWSLRSKIATGESDDAGLGQLLNDWDEEAEHSTSEIKQSNFESLVDYALGAPGVVVGRALIRHWPRAVTEEGYRSTLDAVWNGLRNYLDQRWFYTYLRNRDEKYPDTLLRACVEGNLEAVLDEHLWITSKLRGLSGMELAEELRDGLSVKNGLFYLHPIGKPRDDTFSIRCHVAMPFVQSKARYGRSAEDAEVKETRIRTDEMRRAFNSPFWPYVLATTSVGQEGLDFHAWCDSIVHWDLCRNPVDLEQREGRIQRFGGLSIRRSIASQLGDQSLLTQDENVSPWVRIERLADEQMADMSGLAPWWVCPGGGVKRYVFDVPTSEQRHWLHWMKEQRLLYRLALGQPNQEDLLEILAEKQGMSPEAIRDSVINLSPWFRE